MVEYYQQLAARDIRTISGVSSFDAGIVLGSGLGAVADKIQNKISIPFSRITGFVKSTSEGHKGNLLVGTLGGRNVCVMQGRFHYYEGYDMSQVTFPVRVMRHLGADCLFVTNASGGINKSFRPGDIMVITDHISLLPNPLVGQNQDSMGPRFPDMNKAYDPGLIAAAERIAAAAGIPLKKGVYLAVSGPSYETQAEFEWYRSMGADAVGMSTVPEVIVARHAGMKVFGLSVVTTPAHDAADGFSYDSDDVLAAAENDADAVADIFEGLLEYLK